MSKNIIATTAAAVLLDPDFRGSVSDGPRTQN